MSDRELTNVADSIARHARERPWAVAIIDSTGVIHYRTFDALVWAAAWHLRNAGVRPGDVVGLALPHSALYLVAVYALARMGAGSVALPPSDPKPLREALARRFGVKSVVALSDHAGPHDLPTVRIGVADLKQAPATPQSELRAAGGGAIWNIRRTSGTTGEPKGIARSHRDSLDIYRVQAAYFPKPNHRTLIVLDMATTFGMSVAERGFYGGSTVVVADLPANAADFLSMIDRYGVTHISLTSNYLSALLPHLPADGCRCPGLVNVLVSGMALNEPLRAEIARRFTPNLTNLYGSNETQAMTMADRTVQQSHPGSVGRAYPGVELQIVDDQDNPVPPGAPGHIRARASWMPSGYVNAPDAASRNFRDGWIYVGDIGVLTAEGLLFLRGRADDMMNYDGIKILPVDIEDALLAHPAVVEAVAFPVMSNIHQNLPAAAVILRQPVSAEDLLGHCRARLGVRSPVYISIEQSFPRNSGGKVLRTELAARLSEKT
ncbi:MAG: long-chain acyl-CoA synthetase [Nitrobacter vulgaris]|jgi:acyl-coenzyme A synthetase/AMP-(fatty) acid ligase|nr:long-chain acyl-CoA synthetase [Nitrobacter vulgaris]